MPRPNAGDGRSRNRGSGLPRSAPFSVVSSCPHAKKRGRPRPASKEKERAGAGPAQALLNRYGATLREDQVAAQHDREGQPDVSADGKVLRHGKGNIVHSDEVP